MLDSKARKKNRELCKWYSRDEEGGFSAVCVYWLFCGIANSNEYICTTAMILPYGEDAEIEAQRNSVQIHLYVGTSTLVIEDG